MYNKAPGLHRTISNRQIEILWRAHRELYDVRRVCKWQSTLQLCLLLLA